MDKWEEYRSSGGKERLQEWVREKSRFLVDLETGEILSMGQDGSPCSRADAEGSPQGDTARTEGETLSTVHNEPKVKYRKGASVLTIKTGQVKKDDAGAIERRKKSKRGNVTEFTRKSTARLRRKMGEVQRDRMPYFVTLTYPMEYSTDPKIFKGHLKAFVKRLMRKFSMAAGVWKLEPQERGAPHFHLLIWGVEDDDLTMFVPQAWYEIVGSEDPKHLLWHKGKAGKDNKHCVQKIESLGGVNWYISKYLSKEVIGQISDWGRWWGAFNWINAPLGEEEEKVISLKLAFEIIRYMRRYAKIKSRAYKSLTILCDASQWVNRLL